LRTHRPESRFKPPPARREARIGLHEAAGHVGLHGARVGLREARVGLHEAAGHVGLHEASVGLREARIGLHEAAGRVGLHEAAGARQYSREAERNRGFWQKPQRQGLRGFE
jgi:hypothetical protein